MALTFGWKAAEVRESYWIDDPDLVNVSAAARDAWQEDGDASHLQQFVRPGGKPDRITFRTLAADEVNTVQALLRRVMGDDQTEPAKIEAMLRVARLCFRMAVDFPGAPLEVDAGPDPETGGRRKFKRVVTERGYKMLAEEFAENLERNYPGIVGFYGGLVFRASFASEPEKKASSQPSIPTRSLRVTESPESAAEDAIP